MRTFLARVLGRLWRALGIPPLQGQQPDHDDPPHEGMYPGQMRDDPGEKRPTIQEEVERRNRENDWPQGSAGGLM